MNKIRVLHISPSGNLYGTERHILSIVKYSDKNKFEHVVATPTTGYFNEVLNNLGVKNIHAGKIPFQKNKISWLWKDKSFKKLISVIKNEKFDIIHSHLISYGAFTGKLFSKSKIFHTRHGVFWSEDELKNISFITRLFQKIKSKIFNVTIAIGEYEKETMVKYLGYDINKIRVTFNGVTADEISEKLDSSCNKQQLFGTNDFVVGAVGRLERQKGFDVLVKAAAKVVKDYPNIQFRVIGEGSLREDLHGLRDSLGLQNNFEFMNYKSNIFDYVNQFDIAVQTSLWEGISYVVLEPMALSKPVIALSTLNTSGVKEIIVENETGHLIFENYVDVLSEKIISLYNDREKIRQMGEKGKLRVMEYFTEKRTAADMDKYYLASLK